MNANQSTVIVSGRMPPIAAQTKQHTFGDSLDPKQARGLHSRQSTSPPDDLRGFAQKHENEKQQSTINNLHKALL